MYRIITKKNKDKTNRYRVVHLWDDAVKDTFCQSIGKHKLKPANYWFNYRQSLPDDLCELCRKREAELSKEKYSK